MAKQDDNTETITRDDVENASRELLVLTDLLVQAAEGDFSVYDVTMPNLAAMLCERALTIDRWWTQEAEECCRRANKKAAARLASGEDGNGADKCDALETHLMKAHLNVRDAHALVETLKETLKDDGTKLSVILMIEKKISKAWDQIDRAGIERTGAPSK